MEDTSLVSADMASSYNLKKKKYLNKQDRIFQF